MKATVTVWIELPDLADSEPDSMARATDLEVIRQTVRYNLKNGPATYAVNVLAVYTPKIEDKPVKN